MKIFCVKCDNKMKIVQASITEDYEVLVFFECDKEGCENKVNMLLDSKHTSQIIRDGVEKM